MKSKNIVEQYFHQKEFSKIEIIALIFVGLSLLIATFMRGGIPIGFPVLFVCIVVLFICHSYKIKDSEIDSTLKNIMLENNIDYSENVIACYELRNTVTKKRKDGKIISPDYFVTEIFLFPDHTIFHVHHIDLIHASAQKNTYDVSCSKQIALIEKLIHTKSGVAQTAYLETNSGFTIPIAPNDYNATVLAQKVCNKHSNKEIITK